MACDGLCSRVQFGLLRKAPWIRWPPCSFRLGPERLRTVRNAARGRVYPGCGVPARRLAAASYILPRAGGTRVRVSRCWSGRGRLVPLGSARVSACQCACARDTRPARPTRHAMRNASAIHLCGAKQERRGQSVARPGDEAATDHSRSLNHGLPLAVG
eukprot:scaffold1_cov402-Prasinococcus_capsulatus_cf.AAC.72